MGLVGTGLGSVDLKRFENVHVIDSLSSSHGVIH